MPASHFSANAKASSECGIIPRSQPPVASSASSSSGPSSSLAPVAIDLSDSVALKELLAKIKGPRPRSFDLYGNFDGVDRDLVPIEGI